MDPKPATFTRVDAETYTEGGSHYLSATPGAIANTGIKRIGRVLRAHTTQGMILVEESP